MGRSRQGRVEAARTGNHQMTDERLQPRTAIEPRIDTDQHGYKRVVPEWAVTLQVKDYRCLDSLFSCPAAAGSEVYERNDSLHLQTIASGVAGLGGTDFGSRAVDTPEPENEQGEGLEQRHDQEPQTVALALDGVQERTEHGLQGLVEKAGGF